ncbi:MAG: precorrin-6A reductase [Clostridia bacterium]|nr:precorrin-6A reductase [Clostridia bacterium]
MSILIFGGTIEGRLLAEWCAGEHIPATLSVATEYGAALAPEGEGLCVLTGRMDKGEMEVLMASGRFDRVVDATHPYAAEVTKNLRAAAERTGTPYQRLVRDGAPDGGWLTAEDTRGAAELLKGIPGNILLTTGSKELDVFAGAGLAERCYPRVLPSADSLNRCLELGFPQPHILCMQGPFSQALNEAMLRQYEVKVLVTKATGRAGGFWEKAAAAQNTGCALLVIDRPTKESGLTLEEVQQSLKEVRSVW